MTTTIATPISQVRLASGSATTIAGLTWKTYMALIQELGEDQLTNIAYDRGVLDIRIPGEIHEIWPR